LTLRTPKKLKARPGEVTAVLRRIVAENGRDHRGSYAVVIICSLLVSGATGFSAWVMSPMVNEIFYERRGGSIVWICAGIMGAFIVRGFAGYGQAVMLARIGNNLVARYQKRVFDHLMKLGVNFFNDTRSGRLAAQVDENVSGVRDLLSLTLISITRDAVTLVGLVGLMVYQDPVLSLSSLLIGPPLIWAVVYITRRVRKINRESVLINSRLSGSVQEATQGIAIVKAFTLEDELARRIGIMADTAEQRSNKIARVSERLAPISDMLAGFAVTAVVAYSGYRALVLGQPPG
jgi:ATP-binding cassette subfamily B protein